ncbi:MAG: DnaJ domain-containing protein [Desulfobacterales bacterium]|jgi:curved DNA-binding protein CbpA
MKNTSHQFVNYYDLLKIDPKAGSKEIKQAYLEQVKRWHPDKNPGRSAEAEEKTKVLNQAYHILGDADRRKNYDRMLRFTRGKDYSEFVNDEAFRNKINKAYPSLKKVLENVRELYALFKDAVKGDYKFHPASVAMVGGGLLYFILPADLIPDFIPLVGYLDDLAVLTTIMNSLKGEINAYRSWKETGKKQRFNQSDNT